MRTIEIKIYQASELPDNIRQKALDNYRATDQYAWSKEATESLRAFVNHFGAKIKNWEIYFEEYGYSYVNFDTPHIEPEELESLVGQLKHDGSCQFTGHCSDDDCNQGAVEAFRSGERDVDKILQAGFQFWLKKCKADYAEQLTDEAIIEHCEMNNIEFDEHGEIYKVKRT